MNLSCIVVDDEPLAIDQLKEFISRIPYLDLVMTFSKGFDAMMFLKENAVDIAFLDVQLDDISGLQIIKTIKNKPSIILTTAYQQYAIDGYELEIEDYLLKPVSFERLVRAVDKVWDKKTGKIQKKDITNYEEVKDYIFVRADYHLQRINLNEILFIEGYKDYLRFYLSGKRKIMSLMSFKTLEEHLPPNRFFRVHKSFLVSVDKIDLIEKSSLRIGENIIPIGFAYKKLFFDFVNRQKL